jgi:ATP:ADP antiporter, AAA family
MKKTMPLPTPLKSATPHSPRLFHKAWKKFLEVVFPIQKSELPKFITITALLFCILFVQNIAKALKDSIITTLVATEVIGILKVWCVLPLAILVSVAYVKLIKHVKTEYIFYGVITFFISCFLLFAFVLFPARDNEQIAKTIKYLTLQWPHLKWFLVILKNWDCALLYVIIEMWANVVFALMFWQFVNSVTSVSESKRLYLLFSLLGQTGIFISGVLLENLTNIASLLTNLLNLRSSSTVMCVQIILSIMSTLGAVSMALFWLLNHIIIDKQILLDASFAVKHKQKLSDSLKLVMNSRYIRLIGLLLVSYGTAISTIELMWREHIKSLYSTPELNMVFTGFVLKYSGIVTLLCVLIGSQIIRKFGWKVGAMIPPICTMLSGLMFFMSTNFSAVESTIAAILSIQPAVVALMAGTAQNIITRSTKCTLFDATKEMLYVPLSSELKTQGKACADVMGTKLGKSIGSILQASIFIVLPSATYTSIGTYLMFIFILTCLVWYYAVHQLGHEYNKATQKL